MQDNIFTVKDLSFAYGKQKVLDDLALTLHEGTITTLIGANGCGKSTLLMQYQAWLRENGVPDAQIVSVNFEELEYKELLDCKNCTPI